jgi:phospholipase/carboxylesterase
MNILPHIEINPEKKADSTIIWLHGLGSNGHDFKAIIPELELPTHNRIRFIFPHAPTIPVTINSGHMMPAWYDILEMTFDRKIDKKQLKKSVKAVHAIIDREIQRGINSQRIIIAGFSQGGAVALDAALTYTRRLAGLLGMSTYFPTANSIDIAPANQDLPIQLFHGVYDAIVPETHGQKSIKTLSALGLKPGYQTFMMEHSLCMEEIIAISKWVQALIGTVNRPSGE